MCIFPPSREVTPKPAVVIKVEDKKDAKPGE